MVGSSALLGSRDTGTMWSTLVEPGLPHIQHTSDWRRTWLRRVRHLLPVWPRLRLVVGVAMRFTGGVAWSGSGGPLVQVGAQALHDVGRHVLAEVHLAPGEVTVGTPPDLRCAFTFSPVPHELLGAGPVAGGYFASCNHWASPFAQCTLRR